MGKKKKALQAEIDRLNAQKPRTEVTSYKNLDQTPRTSVAAVLGSAMTGYKTSSGPSMYGTAYNYKNINSCGPSMIGDVLPPIKGEGLKRMDETDYSKLKEKTGLIKGEEGKTRRGLRRQLKAENAGFDNIADYKGAMKEGRQVNRANRKQERKEDNEGKASFADKIEGKHPGIKKMAAESLFRLGEAGVKSVASLIANKRKANLGSSNAFAPRQRSGGGGYSSKSQPSYAQLLSKYQS